MMRAGAATALLALTAGLLTACTGSRVERTTAAADDRYVTVYGQLHPAVVLLTMKIPAVDPKRKGEWDDAYGSGVVVESGPWGSRILTDAHVVEGANDIVATVGDGPHAAAHVVARTGEAEDLAIVDVPLRNQAVAKLGSVTHLVPGTAIGVLGYPIPDAFDDEHLGRTVSLYTGRIASVRNGALEIDVPIIPGESGGPVFEASNGDVIGIAESRFDEERAIGFATPIDVVQRFLSRALARPEGERKAAH